MDSPSDISDPIAHIYKEWSEAVKKCTDDQQRIDYFCGELPRLMKTAAFFRQIMERISKGKPYPDIQRSGIFENEIVLHRNPSHLFSLRIAFYEPSEFTFIHDHSSWGVFGTILGPLEVLRYHRTDDGAKEGVAEISECRRLMLKPMQVDFTHALNEGIHSIGNPGESLSVTASIYGKPVRRVFINRFDPKNNSVDRIYPPKIKKKKQAKKALSLLSEASL